MNMGHLIGDHESWAYFGLSDFVKINSQVQNRAIACNIELEITSFN